MKHEGWINIYRDYKYPYVTSEHIYETEEMAREDENLSCYVTTIKIEWEE